MRFPTHVFPGRATAAAADADAPNAPDAAAFAIQSANQMTGDHGTALDAMDDVKDSFAASVDVARSGVKGSVAATAAGNVAVGADLRDEPTAMAHSIVIMQVVRCLQKLFSRMQLTLLVLLHLSVQPRALAVLRLRVLSRLLLLACRRLQDMRASDLREIDFPLLPVLAWQRSPMRLTRPHRTPRSPIGALAVNNAPDAPASLLQPSVARRSDGNDAGGDGVSKETELTGVVFLRHVFMYDRCSCMMCVHVCIALRLCIVFTVLYLRTVC